MTVWRRDRSHAARGALAAIVIVAASGAAAAELWQRSWVEARSARFVIVSAISEPRTIELAKELESFRIAVQRVAGLEPFEERVATRVYVFPYALEEFGFKGVEPNQIVGYFSPRMRGNYAAIVDTSAPSADEVMKHEYLHYLLHNSEPRSYPLWFDEGFAQLFQTLTVRGTTIEYGRPRRLRGEQDRVAWMPFDELLEVRDTSELKGSKLSKFYAQSWLLLQYLTQRRGHAAFQLQFHAFLDAGDAGASQVDAFERAFGVKVNRLRSVLMRYVAGAPHYQRVELAQPLPDVAVVTRPVSGDSIAAELGWLLMALGEKDAAGDYWNAALALNPDNASALIGQASQLASSGAFAAAEARYQRAIELEPISGYHELDYGAYFLYRARCSDDRQTRDAMLVEARRHFARSYELDPNNPETLALNGASYMFPGEPLVRALRSLRVAHAMLPSQAHIKLLLAQAYAMGGSDDEAAALLRSVVAWADPDNAVPAHELLQQIEARRKQSLSVREDPASQ
jgi:tetratricopeptide (TPR) repeat protein